MRQRTKRNLGYASLLLISMALVIVLLAFSSLNKGGDKPLSIIALSEVTVYGGKVYWVATGTADSLDSGYSFYYLPSAHTLPDGTTVTPQDSLSVLIKTQDKKCTYLLQPKSKTLYSIPIIPYVWYYDWTYNYKVLYNPAKSFLIKVTPNRGNVITMNGATQDSKDIHDPDGNGKVTVSTLGALGTAYNCPESSDIAVIHSGGDSKIISKSELENDLDSLPDSLLGIIINWLLGLGPDPVTVFFTEYQENFAFTSSFEIYPAITDSSITGSKDMGNPVFTITADQDYFNSVVYSPPTSADPYIDNINIQDTQSGSSESFSVKVKNHDSTPGNVILTVSSPHSTINPSSQNFLLTTSSTKYLTISSDVFSVRTSDPITAEVCTTNQFGDNKCDSKTVSHYIIPDSPPHYCGDGVCDANEDATTCPTDCHFPTNCSKESEVCASDSDCCPRLSCQNDVCVTSTECEGCWSWLKDKMNMELTCSKPSWWSIPVIGWFGQFFSDAKNNLFCPFYFVKLIIMFFLSLFGFLFAQNFLRKTFRNLPTWATWLIGLSVGAGLFIVGYFLLTWWFMLIAVIIVVAFGIISAFIRPYIPQRRYTPQRRR